MGSISDGLQCLLSFIVYWAALPTGGLHGLLAGFMAYWQASRPTGSLHSLLELCVVYYCWAALSTEQHGLLLGFMP